MEENYFSSKNGNGRNDNVESAIKIIQENQDSKTERDNKNYLIQKLFEEGFEVADPRGTRKIGSKTLYQAIWKMVSRMKPLDFTIHGGGRPELFERLVTAGVSMVLDEGGYTSALRDKNGAFWNLLTYGDAFIHVGTTIDDVPVVINFNAISNSNLYVDQYATGIRSGGWSRKATKAVVVFSFSEDKFQEEFGKIKGVDVENITGRIPRDVSFYKEIERSYTQTQDLEDIVEVAFYYDLNDREYCVFAGSEAKVLFEKNGNKYPFVIDEVPYIPVLHFYCMPSSEGFWNHGVGDMLYDLAVITRRLLNLEVGHIEENVYPITMLNVPKGKSAEFFNKLENAYKLRANGKKGFVSMEYDIGTGGSDNVQAQSLLTQNMASEWQMIYDRLEREMQRMGIILDEVERGQNVTATQIMAEEEGANAFVKQIMENNASETKFAVEMTMDFIKKLVPTMKKASERPLNLTTKLDLGDGVEVKTNSITLGQVADELNKHKYFVRVNARSGAIPSNVLQQAQLTRMLQLTPPGTPAYYKLVHQLSALNDRDIDMAEFQPPQPQAPQGEPQEQEGGAQTASPGETPQGPSETDRLRISPEAQEMPIL